jgi:hypothetical protein
MERGWRRDGEGMARGWRGDEEGKGRGKDDTLQKNASPPLSAWIHIDLWGIGPQNDLKRKRPKKKHKREPEKGSRKKIQGFFL